MDKTRATSAWLARASVEEAFRNDYGRLFGALVRSFRDFDLAEDALQEALASALKDWPATGIPSSPAATNAFSNMYCVGLPPTGWPMQQTIS